MIMCYDYKAPEIPWEMQTNAIFLPFVKQQTEAPNSYYDASPPS